MSKKLIGILWKSWYGAQLALSSSVWMFLPGIICTGRGLAKSSVARLRMTLIPLQGGQRRIHFSQWISFLFLHTDYHKLGSLKRHTFLISRFPWVESLGKALLSPLFRDSQDCTQGVRQAMFSSGGLTREESTSMLTQVIGRIYFLEAVRLRAQPLLALNGSPPTALCHVDFSTWELTSSGQQGESLTIY